MAGAFTEIELDAARPDVAIQLDTAVRGPHRGLGLGRLVKAHMMQWLAADRPSLERVATGNAADNEHMIRVNAELGYVAEYTTTDMEAAAEELAGSQGW